VLREMVYVNVCGVGNCSAFYLRRTWNHMKGHDILFMQMGAGIRFWAKKCKASGDKVYIKSSWWLVVF